MSERGAFLIDRGWFDHPAFRTEPFTEREAWAWLISEAAYKPHQRRLGSAVVQLQRGQLGASVRFLAERWKWSKSRVDRFLLRLKNRDNDRDRERDRRSRHNHLQKRQISAWAPIERDSKRDTYRDKSGTAAGQIRSKGRKE